MIVRPLTSDERGREPVAELDAEAQESVGERDLIRPGTWVLGAFGDEGAVGVIAVVPDRRDGGQLEAELRPLRLPEAGSSHRELVSDALLRGGTEWALREGIDRVHLAEGVSLADGANAALTHPLQERADVRVREIREAEIPAVSELVLEAYREDYARLPEEYLAEIADVAARAARHLVWVAEDQDTGELLGTITTPRPGLRMSDVARDGEMDLRLLGVARAARGRRVGSLLMRHGLRLARLRGTPRVVLNTSTEMVAAYEMYDRMGFERLLDREQHIVREDGSEFTLLAYGIDIAT